MVVLLRAWPIRRTPRAWSSDPCGAMGSSCSLRHDWGQGHHQGKGEGEGQGEGQGQGESETQGDEGEGEGQCQGQC